MSIFKKYFNMVSISKYTYKCCNICLVNEHYLSI